DLALSLGEDHPSVAELRCATDLSLRLTRCTSQALGRVMGAAVATQSSLWLSLAEMSDREKAPLLDAPVSVQGALGRQWSQWLPSSKNSRRAERHSRLGCLALVARVRRPPQDIPHPQRARREARCALQS